MFLIASLKKLEFKKVTKSFANFNRLHSTTITKMPLIDHNAIVTENREATALDLLISSEWIIGNSDKYAYQIRQCNRDDLKYTTILISKSGNRLGLLITKVKDVESIHLGYSGTAQGFLDMTRRFDLTPSSYDTTWSYLT